MWLLNAMTKSLEWLHEDVAFAAGYAILSHVWSDEEVTFNDMQQPDLAKSKKGYQKVVGACRQALLDGLVYIWIDSCCIDKSSSAELSEAINSMFKWYYLSDICYVFLRDVSWTEGDELDALTDVTLYYFEQSTWFTRGWTLQELIAPRNLVFFSDQWRPLGTKSGMCQWLARVTGVESVVLQNIQLVQRTSVAKRMSWAAERETTREEDRAYSLLGLFGVRMPLLYGEGSKAFFRLQQEIIRTNTDHSIFLRELSRDDRELLGASPDGFHRSRKIVRYANSRHEHFELINSDIRTTLPMLGPDEKGRTFVVLNCRYEDDFDGPIGLEVECIDTLADGLSPGEALHVRLLHQQTENCRFYTIPLSKAHLAQKRLLLITGEDEKQAFTDIEAAFSVWLQTSPSFDDNFSLIDVSPKDVWNPDTAVLYWSPSWVQDDVDVVGHAVWVSRRGSYISLIFAGSRRTGLGRRYWCRVILTPSLPTASHYIEWKSNAKSLASAAVASTGLAGPGEHHGAYPTAEMTGFDLIPNLYDDGQPLRSLQVLHLGDQGSVTVSGGHRTIMGAAVCVVHLDHRLSET